MEWEDTVQGDGTHDAGLGGALLDFSFMLMEDIDSGKVRTIEHYQGRFPGYEEEIESEFNLICDEAKTEPEEPAPHDPNDRRIGSYKIESELGRGGQATVYAARDTRMDRSVALKVLSSTLGRIPPETMERFRREADSVANIDHPCICDVFEADFECDPPYIAMRLVSGESIRQHIQRAMLIEAGELESGRDAHLPCNPQGDGELFTVLRAFERLARALHAAHEDNVIHRDIKPANLIIDESGTPIILDFGLARVGGENDSNLTMTGEIFGTPAYMPPELLRGQVDDPGPTLDVYALAVTLYECLTLKRPFDATTPEALYNQILEQDAPSARVHKPELPKEVAVVLATALEKDLKRRYGSSLDLAEELRRICDHEPILAIPAGPTLRLKRWFQRYPALGMSIAASVLFLVGGLTVSLSLLNKVTTERDRKEELLVEVVTERDRKEELLVEVAEERDQKEQVLEIYKATYYREKAKTALKTDPLYATLLASEAYRREPIEINHRGMRVAMSQTFDERRTLVPFQNFKNGSGFISDSVMNPMTKQLIYVDRTDNLWVYDHSKDEVTRVLEGPISDELDENTKSEMAAKMAPAMKVAMDPASEALFLTRRSGEVIEVRSPDAQEVRAELAVEGERLSLVTPRSDVALTSTPPLEGERFSAGPVRLWDVASGELISELPLEEGMLVLWAELSPTEDLAAVSLYPKDPTQQVLPRLELWDVRSAQFIKQVGIPMVSLLGAWSPRGDRLLTGSLMEVGEPGDPLEWESALWSIPEAEFLAKLEQDQPCAEVSFSSDGEHLATACADDGLVYVWDGRDGESLGKFEGHDARDFVTMHFSPTNPDLLATTSIDQSTRVWDVSKGEQTNLFVGMTSPPNLNGAGGWTEDSYYLLSEKGVLHAWRSGPPVWPRKITTTEEEVVAAWFDTDGDALIIEKYTEGERHTGGVERVNWRTGEVLVSHQWAEESVNPEVVDSIRKTVSGRSNGYRGDPRGSFEVVEWNWETDTERVVATTEERITSISTSIEGDPRNLLLMANQELEVWDFERAEQLFVVNPSDRSAQWIMSEWGPEAELLATGAADGFVRLWDGESGELIRELGPFTAHNGDPQILDLLFSPSEGAIYAACKDARIRKWDVETGELLLEQASHTMSTLNLVGQDQLLGSALYNGKMVLFDLSSQLGNSVQLNMGTKPTSYISISPDKRHVLFSDTLSPAKLLDMSQFRAGTDLKERVQVGSFSTSLDPGEVQESTFEITEFSPDGGHVMAVHEGVVWIWPTDLLTAAEEMCPVGIDYFGRLPSPSLTSALEK